jgi:predicted anti-sigma-YlaC factor YlaD
MVRARSQECERIRASVSAALDGELSEFESLLVRAHLDRCDTCREFEASAQLSTMALRAAPLEPLSRPLALPSRRRRAFALRVPSAAAAAVLMVIFGGVFESLHGGAARPSAIGFNNTQDIHAIAKRQQQANRVQLIARRALYESNQMVRHPGFQNP